MMCNPFASRKQNPRIWHSGNEFSPYFGEFFLRVRVIFCLVHGFYDECNWVSIVGNTENICILMSTSVPLRSHQYTDVFGIFACTRCDVLWVQVSHKCFLCGVTECTQQNTHNNQSHIGILQGTMELCMVLWEPSVRYAECTCVTPSTSDVSRISLIDTFSGDAHFWVTWVPPEKLSNNILRKNIFNYNQPDWWTDFRTKPQTQ